MRHYAQAIPVNVSYGDGRGFQASCSCGWVADARLYGSGVGRSCAITDMHNHLDAVRAGRIR